MASAMSCRFLNGLFGPGTAPVPVWGAKENMAALAHALDMGLSIHNTTSTTGKSEAFHAVEAVVGWLQRTGKAPFDLQEISGLSDEQRKAYGFEPRMEAMDPAASVQDMGVPPFKDLDMAIFLASLRTFARYQELLTGSKPVFQVGVLTLTVQDTREQFFAQTLMAEAGEATDTVWLYRWCTMDLNGHYEEHWRPFDSPVGVQSYPDVALPQDQTVLPNATDHSVAIPYPSETTKKPAPPQQLPKRQRAPKHKRWQHFEHQYLSDHELFAATADLLQGPAILRLAHSYSNQDIFDRINAARPEGTGIRSVNVITKRLTHAIQAAAKASGRSVQEIRAEVMAAKYRNGVRHKGKVDVAPYA
ncbi:hypothetical protein MBLNU13_g07618t1 [Cladosporium sp. NU13]